jgi:hypothetical protein
LKNVKKEEAIVMETALVNSLYLAILFILFWLGLFVIPRILLRRAISQVISIFRRSHSLCSESPKTVDELGLAPQSLMNRLFKLRDYKPYALQFLVKAGIVRQTEGGKLCLAEEKLPQLLRYQ